MQQKAIKTETKFFSALSIPRFFSFTKKLLTKISLFIELAKQKRIFPKLILKG
jgi:hypothetical protein